MEELQEFMTPGVRGIVRSTRIVNRKKFLKLVQPGDIILTQYKNNIVKDMFRRFRSEIIRVFQGSIYSSSKIVLDNKMAYGFGADPKQGTQILSKIPLKKLVYNLQGAYLIRVPDLDLKQKAKINKFIKQRMNTNYATSQLLKTAWNKFIRINPLKLDLNDPKTKKQVEIFKNPLICSTIISMAFLYVGVKFLKNPLEVWPRNFITSPTTIKICRFV